MASVSFLVRLWVPGTQTQLRSSTCCFLSTFSVVLPWDLRWHEETLKFYLWRDPCAGLSQVKARHLQLISLQDCNNHSYVLRRGRKLPPEECAFTVQSFPCVAWVYAYFHPKQTYNAFSGLSFHFFVWNRLNNNPLPPSLTALRIIIGDGCGSHHFKHPPHKKIHDNDASVAWECKQL